MDVLDHMLTDPLDSEKANDGHITEECMLGDCRVSLPEDLLEDVSSKRFHVKSHLSTNVKFLCYLFFN